MVSRLDKLMEFAGNEQIIKSATSRVENFGEPYEKMFNSTDGIFEENKIEYTSFIFGNFKLQEGVSDKKMSK